MGTTDFEAKSFPKAIAMLLSCITQVCFRHQTLLQGYTFKRRALRRPATGTSTSNSAGLARTAQTARTVHRSDSNALCNSTAKLCFPSPWARNGNLSATVPWWLLLVSLASFFADPKLAGFADFADFAERRASSRGSPCHQPRYDLENHSNHSHTSTILNASPLQLCLKKVTHSWPCAATCGNAVHSSQVKSCQVARLRCTEPSSNSVDSVHSVDSVDQRRQRFIEGIFRPWTVNCCLPEPGSFHMCWINPGKPLSLTSWCNFGVSHLWGCEDPMMRKLAWSVSFDLFCAAFSALLEFAKMVNHVKTMPIWHIVDEHDASIWAFLWIPLRIHIMGMHSSTCSSRLIVTTVTWTPCWLGKFQVEYSCRNHWKSLRMLPTEVLGGWIVPSEINQCTAHPALSHLLSAYKELLPPSDLRRLQKVVFVALRQSGKHQMSSPTIAVAWCKKTTFTQGTNSFPMTQLRQKHQIRFKVTLFGYLSRESWESVACPACPCFFARSENASTFLRAKTCHLRKMTTCNHIFYVANHGCAYMRCPSVKTQFTIHLPPNSCSL